VNPDRWSRVEGIVDIAEQRRKRVLVVGLGSGGATVAVELAKAGVARFTLVDPDRIEETNVIRHECDDRYVGMNKAVAVADLIRHRNPAAEVAALPSDAFELGPRLEELVSGADLVAVCTDAEAPKRLLNRLCIGSGVPAVYAGVYERGTGGEVIRCGGGPADPCYACVGSVLKEGVSPPEAGELDYGAVDAHGEIHGAPGLGLDVRLVALLHAKVCLLTLLGSEELGGNVVLFGNAAVEGLFPRPFASAVLQMSPQAGCLICGPSRQGAAAV
jgi:hypothetical protein